MGGPLLACSRGWRATKDSRGRNCLPLLTMRTFWSMFGLAKRGLMRRFALLLAVLAFVLAPLSATAAPAGNSGNFPSRIDLRMGSFRKVLRAAGARLCLSAPWSTARFGEATYVRVPAR
jgi:hypothetical protein